MATNTGVPEKMDLKTLSHVVSLRQKNGLHIDYQYGIKINEDDWDFKWPDPKYNGCSLRVFIYNRVNTFAKVRMALPTNPHGYYGTVHLSNSTIQLSYGDGKDQTQPNDPTGPISLGRFFSIGLRMDGNLIRPLVDEWVGSGYNLGKIIANENWNTKIYTGLNYMVSLHLCDEVGASFPSRGLNHAYEFGFPLPIGSHVTVFAVFTGGTPDGQKIQIFPQFGIGGPVREYDNTPLTANEEFRITAKNTFEGWVLATSFLNQRQTPRLVLRSTGEKYTNIEVSNNCYIRRILAMCGPLPQGYKPGKRNTP